MKRGEYFDSKIYYQSPTGCHIWEGIINKYGYGLFWYKRKRVYAHRYALQRIGKLPPNLTVDHKCYNRRCVNPEHLEAVTRSENVKRMHNRR